MSTKHSPGKITLGMIKGKPITTSVPIIHYHASDDELEELYPSTDEEKQLPSESEKISSKVPSSPHKSLEKKVEDGECSDNNLDKRSSGVDANASEGTGSDPWKVLFEIKGKISKTFESLEKFSEIKSERKKRRNQYNKESSSISDFEDFGDITPTEENITDWQDKETAPLLTNRKNHSSRFVGFSHVKTGLKTRNSEEDSVESGIEAAEFAEDIAVTRIQFESETYTTNAEIANKSVDDMKEHSISKQSSTDSSTNVFLQRNRPEMMIAQLKTQLIYQLTYWSGIFLSIILGFYYCIPLPEYFRGIGTGIFLTICVYNILNKIKTILTTLPNTETSSNITLPVFEVPAAEEHAVLERFEGWLNELPYTYDPDNYHVARTKPVYFRLEGEILRIMETKMRIPKKAIWDEPKHKLKFTKRRMYNLTEGKVDLLPNGLIRRRCV